MLKSAQGTDIRQWKVRREDRIHLGYFGCGCCHKVGSNFLALILLLAFFASAETCNQGLIPKVLLKFNKRIVLSATMGEEIGLASAILVLEKICIFCCKWENVSIFNPVVHMFIWKEYILEINFVKKPKN